MTKVIQRHYKAQLWEQLDNYLVLFGQKYKTKTYNMILHKTSAELCFPDFNNILNETIHIRRTYTNLSSLTVPHKSVVFYNRILLLLCANE